MQPIPFFGPPTKKKSELYEMDPLKFDVYEIMYLRRLHFVEINS